MAFLSLCDTVRIKNVLTFHPPKQLVCRLNLGVVLAKSSNLAANLTNTSSTPTQNPTFCQLRAILSESLFLDMSCGQIWE